MKEHFCPAEKTTITYQGECSWCGESEGSMNEIIEMAKEAGFFIIANSPDLFSKLVAFANLVAAKATEEANAKANASWTLMCKKMVAIEREACANLCEANVWSEDVAWWRETTKSEVAVEAGLQCAAAIRARGQA